MVQWVTGASRLCQRMNAVNASCRPVLGDDLVRVDAVYAGCRDGEVERRALVRVRARTPGMRERVFLRRWSRDGEIGARSSARTLD